MLYLKIFSRHRQTQSRHWPRVLMNRTLYGKKRQSMQNISLDYFWYPLTFLLSIYRAWHAVTADGGRVIVVLRSWQCLRAYSSFESGFLPQPALLSVQEDRPLADWGLSRRVDRSWWLKLPRVLTMDGAHGLMNKQILFSFVFISFHLWIVLTLIGHKWNTYSKSQTSSKSATKVLRVNMLFFVS